MSNKKKGLDPRVIRSRHLLRDALMELIPEKGYESITVGDITERATLNRATFYLHYRDKDDLLYTGMTEILDELISPNPIPVAQDGTLSVEETIQALVRDFEHFAQYADYYRVMLGEKGVSTFIWRLQNYIYKLTKERLKIVHGELIYGPVVSDLVLRFTAAAYVGVIQWWLKDDMQYSPKFMAKQVVWLYTFGVYKALGINSAISADTFIQNQMNE